MLRFMKLWSQFFVPTLKESPADAEIASHKLLVRAGLVRRNGALEDFVRRGHGSLRGRNVRSKVRHRPPKMEEKTGAGPVFSLAAGRANYSPT